MGWSWDRNGESGEEVTTKNPVRSMVITWCGEQGCVIWRLAEVIAEGSGYLSKSELREQINEWMWGA